MPLEIRYLPLDDLTPYEKNPRTHTAAQIKMIERSLQRFGWATPIAVADGVLIYGHARREAAINLRKKAVPIRDNPDPNLAPVVDLSHLTPDERRAYVIADNQLAAQAGWDNELLSLEVRALDLAGFEIGLLGFGDKELGRLTLDPEGDEVAGSLLELADIANPEPKHRVEEGDHWRLHGKHHLLVCSVFEDWPIWKPLLRKGSLFVPYPGPFIPFGPGAEKHVLVMVQPDPYAAAHLLDRFMEARGADAVEKLSREQSTHLDESVAEVAEAA